MNNLLKEKSENVIELIQAVETRANKNPFLRTLIQAARAYGEDHCSLIAAALSYYALLSIFPLMLFLVTVASNFFPSERLIRSISGFFAASMPINPSMLTNTLRQVIELRGALTLASTLGFLWSAAGVFDMIQLGINRAFRAPRARPIWQKRLLSFAMVTGVSILFLLNLILSTALRLALRFQLIERGDALISTITNIATFLISIGIFGMLFRHIPYGMRVRWHQVWLGAVTSAILWEIAKMTFAWYITNYALLNLVYGSIGAVIAIMLWSYITSAIMLFGAEIAAVMAGARQRERKGDEWWSITAQ
ncbi:MAG: YihY/virulence factor BrkB family protein [Chloroflexi bacterium]|nr:YihY/virulence factor BrkB family protein [Chloroflexota bacterium]